MIKIGVRNYFLVHFVSFFVYALLHPMRFFQMKDVINIYLSVVSFISVALMVFQNDSPLMK